MSELANKITGYLPITQNMPVIKQYLLFTWNSKLPRLRCIVPVNRVRSHSAFCRPLTVLWHLLGLLSQWALGNNRYLSWLFMRLEEHRWIRVSLMGIDYFVAQCIASWGFLRGTECSAPLHRHLASGMMFYPVSILSDPQSDQQGLSRAA